MANNKKSGFGIIGLGRFGLALAKVLAEAGEEVLVIDEQEANIRIVRDIVHEPFLVGKLTYEALEETGINECETVIICISKVDVSVLTTQIIIEMGVPRVISKADSKEHGMILEKLGADVVFPEIETATRIAAILLESRAIDLMRLNDGHVIAEIKIPELEHAISIEGLKLSKYNIKLVAIEKNVPSETITEFNREIELVEDDAVVVIGRFVDIKRFEHHVIKR